MPYKDINRRREYQRMWLSKRRSDWFTVNGPCKKCGSSRNLQVDHVDPKQKITHNFWSWSPERMNQELEKCQVLCRGCHKEKTLEQRKRTAHGKLCMYQDYKCRCDLCKEAKRKDGMMRKNPTKFLLIYGRYA